MKIVLVMTNCDKNCAGTTYQSLIAESVFEKQRPHCCRKHKNWKLIDARKIWF